MMSLCSWASEEQQYPLFPRGLVLPGQKLLVGLPACIAATGNFIIGVLGDNFVAQKPRCLEVVCVSNVFTWDISRWSMSRKYSHSLRLISSASTFGPAKPNNVSSALGNPKFRRCSTYREVSHSCSYVTSPVTASPLEVTTAIVQSFEW